MSHIDLTYLKNSSGNNTDFIKSMITVFLKNTPEYISELKKIYKTQDWLAFRQVMHKIKPTFPMLGINEMSEIVYNIDNCVKNQQNLEDVPKHIQEMEDLSKKVFIELKEMLKKLN